MWVITDFDDLVVTGSSSLHLAVSNLARLASRVAGLDLLHALDSLELGLHAPEAPRSEYGSLLRAHLISNENSIIFILVKLYHLGSTFRFVQMFALSA